MSGKAIYFIVVLLIFGLFASVNIQNVVTVNFGFKTFENVPVFIFALFSFLVGFLLTVPFFISSKKNTSKHESHLSPKREESDSIATDTSVSTSEIQEVELKGEKKSWIEKLKENKKTDDNKTK
ncbi:MAG: DUF1049 domain-containing protein [Spirochaetaceae bacterium]|nr:DUF1049 domain-containing protein [Spirochaetaceae bacterium]